MRTAYRPTGSRFCARTSAFTCASPTVRCPLHSSTQPAQGQRARSHLAGNRLSLPSSQRSWTPPSGETATSVGRTGATCGLILSRRPIVLVTISHLHAPQRAVLPRGGASVRSGDAAPRLGAGLRPDGFRAADAVPAVIGLDHAPAMLRRARRRDPRLVLVRGDARGLPLRDGSLDAVTFHSVLYLLPDRAAALRETARVLRPGGRAVLLEPQDGVRAAGKALLRALPRPRWAMTALLWRTMSGFYGSFSAGQLRLLLEEAGLRVLKLDEALDGLGLLAVAERPG